MYFAQAHDFETCKTGAGIREREGYTSFREKMIAKCPFYYDLKDVFCARSGVCPKVTSKDLYDEDVAFEAGSVGSLAGDDDDRSLSVSVLGATSSDEDLDAASSTDPPAAAKAKQPTAASARKLTAQASGKNLPSAKKNSSAKHSGSSTKKSLRSRGGHKKQKKSRNSSDDDDGPSALERVATHWMYTRMKREEKTKSAAASIAELSTLFKTTADNLGSRVKAAFQCPDFERFLELEECAELKQYRADMEAARGANA